MEDVSALQTGKWYEYKMIWKSSDSPTAYQSAETDIYKVCVADSVVPTLKVGTYFGDPITIQWNPVENAVGYRIYTAIPYTETRDGQTTEREAYQYLGETTKKETIAPTKIL